jgi:hypothetical protein
MNRSFLSDLAAISEALQYTTNFHTFKKFRKYFISLSLLAADGLYRLHLAKPTSIQRIFHTFKNFRKYFYFAASASCCRFVPTASSEACQYTTNFEVFQAGLRKSSISLPPTEVGLFNALFLVEPSSIHQYLP